MCICRCTQLAIASHEPPMNAKNQHEHQNKRRHNHLLF